MLGEPREGDAAIRTAAAASLISGSIEISRPHGIFPRKDNEPPRESGVTAGSPSPHG
jgi:hypothetical protein